MGNELIPKMFQNQSVRTLQNGLKWFQNRPKIGSKLVQKGTKVITKRVLNLLGHPVLDAEYLDDA